MAFQPGRHISQKKPGRCAKPQFPGFLAAEQAVPTAGANG